MNMRLIKKMMKYMKHFINSVFYHQYWVNYKNGENHRWSCISPIIFLTGLKFPYSLIIAYILERNNIILSKPGIFGLFIIWTLITFTLYASYFYRGKRYIKIIEDDVSYSSWLCKYFHVFLILKMFILLTLIGILFYFTATNQLPFLK